MAKKKKKNKRRKREGTGRKRVCVCVCVHACNAVNDQLTKLTHDLRPQLFERDKNGKGREKANAASVVARRRAEKGQRSWSGVKYAFFFALRIK